MHVELAEHHRAGRPQPFHHGRVDGGDKIFIDLGAAGGAHAARGEKVLYGDGDSVERPAVAPGGQLGIRLPRLFTSLFGGDGDERIELGIEPADARGGGGRQFDG